LHLALANPADRSLENSEILLKTFKPTKLKLTDNLLNILTRNNFKLNHTSKFVQKNLNHQAETPPIPLFANGQSELSMQPRTAFTDCKIKTTSPSDDAVLFTTFVQDL
jgi:hypothetical protein